MALLFCWCIIWMSNNLDLRWSPTFYGGFIWIQIVCIGHQRSSKFTASGLRVKCSHIWNLSIAQSLHQCKLEIQSTQFCLAKFAFSFTKIQRFHLRLSWYLYIYNRSVKQYSLKKWLHVLWASSGSKTKSRLHLRKLTVQNLCQNSYHIRTCNYKVSKNSNQKALYLSIKSKVCPTKKSFACQGITNCWPYQMYNRLINPMQKL